MLTRLIFAALLASGLPLLANERIYGYCEQGGHTVAVPGSHNSTTRVQQSYPNCLVTVYLVGTSIKATLYADNNNTPLANPFTADTKGYWFFYSANGRYDVFLSGPASTLGDVLANDGSGGGGGGGTPAAPVNSTQFNSAGVFGGVENSTGTIEFLSQVSSASPVYLELTSSYLSDWLTAPSGIVSALPAASSSTFKVSIVTDGADSTDCTVGGGSTLVWCRSDGANWSNVGGSTSSGGTVTDVTASLPLASSGGTTPNIMCSTCATGSAFTNFALIIGQGTQALTQLSSLGTTTTLLHGNASGLPTFGSVNLAADVSGILPISALSASSLTVSAGGGLSGGGAVSLGGTTTLSANIGTTAGTVAAGNDSRFNNATSLRGINLLAGVPIDGQVYQYVLANNDWELTTPAGGGGGGGTPGGGANSIQYNNAGAFAGVVNASATKGYLYQTNSGVAAFQLVPITNTEITPIDLASTSNGGITGTLAAAHLPTTLIYNNQVNTYVNQATPSAPSAGNTVVWTGSVSKVLSARNDAGTTSITVVPNAGVANSFVTALSTSGVLTLVQPSTTSLSDAAAVARRSTVASLPAAAGESGKMWFVTDGTSATDCTTGLSNFIVPCTSNGSVWAAQSIGSASQVAVQNNGGTTIGTQAAIRFLTSASSYITWTLVNGAGFVSIQPVLDTAQIARLQVAQSFTAGAKNTHTQSGTTAGMNFGGAALPSTPASGDWVFDASVNPNWYDGSAWRKAAYASTTLTSAAPLIGCGTNCINVGTTTGSGSLIVLNNTPTLLTPTIASFTNATHNHTNAAGGGQLATTAFSAGVLTGNGLKFVTGTGSYVAGDCLTVDANFNAVDSGAACGSGGTGITSLNGLGAATQVFANDTNVTISSATATHTLGWTGTLAKARTLATTTYTDQTNVFGAFLQNFASSSLKVPLGAGLAPTTSGLIGYNSTSNLFVGGVNGVSVFFPYFTGSQSGCLSISSGVLSGSGSACGTGGGGGSWSSLTSGDNSTADLTMSGTASLSATGTGTITATDLIGSGAFSLVGATSNTVPTLIAGQLGLWFSLADANLHLRDTSNNTSTLIRTLTNGSSTNCSGSQSVTGFSANGLPTCTVIPAVTSIATTGPIVGGTITSTGTLSCPTCGTAAGTLTSGQLLFGSGVKAIVTGNLSGDVTTSGSATTTLATVNSGPGACGDSTHVCQVTTNSKGLTTAQTPVLITGGGGGGALPTISSTTTGKQLSNNGSSAAWTSPVLDCSQFAGADMSLKIQACGVAANTANPQGAVLDARGFSSAQTWSVNPLGGTLPRGGVLLVPQIQMTTSVPVVLPNHWSIKGDNAFSNTTQAGSTITAGGSFHAWANPDTGTITTATGNGSSGVTVTGSGTAFTSSMIGCALVAGSGITMGTGLTVAGIIHSVTSTSNLNVSFNVPNAAFSGHTDPYAIYCPVVLMGEGEPGASSPYEFGNHLEYLDVRCAAKAGCVGIMNWFSDEGSSVHRVSIHEFTNIGLDIETPYPQNSGPYDDMSISGDATCSAGTLNLVSRVNAAGSLRDISNITSATPGCSPTQAVNFDIESTGSVVRNIHFDSPSTVGLAVGGIAGAAVPCPVACASGRQFASASQIINISTANSVTTAVRIASGLSGIVVQDVNRNGGTNLLIDDSNGSCAVTATHLGMYVIDDGGTKKFSTATSGCTVP